MEALEGDFLETKEGLIFDVKGDCHPPDRIISFVRYVPDPEGDRKKKGRAFRKIYDLKERYQFLKKHFPHYIYFDPVFQQTLQGVPHKNLKIVYYPREKLRELIAHERDAVEESTVQLAQRLNIPTEALGVSGSVLVELHTPVSDMDLVVYGKEVSIRAYEHLAALREKGIIKAFNHEKASEIARFRWGAAPEALVNMEQRKILHGLFQEKDYFFRLLKTEKQTRTYGDIQYVPLHKATVKATVADDANRIFTPCRYELEDSSIEEVSRIVSWRGRFCEQAKKGDPITARGTVEKVLTAADEYYHLILGEEGDFLLPHTIEPGDHL